MAYTDPTSTRPASLCYSCIHQQLVPNTRGSVFSLCRRSRDEPDASRAIRGCPCCNVRDMNAKVTRLQTAAIKGTRLRSVEQVTLGRSGAAGDRRFFLVDDRGRMLNSMVLGELHTVSAGFDESSGRLSLEFDDGRVWTTSSPRRRRGNHGLRRVPHGAARRRAVGGGPVDAVRPPAAAGAHRVGCRPGTKGPSASYRAGRCSASPSRRRPTLWTHAGSGC